MSCPLHGDADYWYLHWCKYGYYRSSVLLHIGTNIDLDQFHMYISVECRIEIFHLACTM